MKNKIINFLLHFFDSKKLIGIFKIIIINIIIIIFFYLLGFILLFKEIIVLLSFIILFLIITGIVDEKNKYIRYILNTLFFCY